MTNRDYTSIKIEEVLHFLEKEIEEIDETLESYEGSDNIIDRAWLYGRKISLIKTQTMMMDLKYQKRTKEGGDKL